MIHRVQRDGEVTRRRLRAAGFEFVAFDPTTPTIEKDPTATLHQKVRHSLDWAEGFTTTVFRDPNGRIVLFEIPDVESERGDRVSGEGVSTRPRAGLDP